MTVIATDDGKRLSSLIVKTDSDYFPFYTEVFTVNEATAKTYKIGQTLGTVTATSKAKAAVETAVDGSKVVSGIYIGDALGNSGDLAVAANTDTKVLVLVRGKVSLKNQALVWDATYDTQAKKDTAFATLAGRDVLLVNEAKTTY